MEKPLSPFLGIRSPTTGKALAPVGFKVVRVDVQTGVIHEFAANKGKKTGPASATGNGGLERPVAARFDPSGKALYVVDFGILKETERVHSLSRKQVCCGGYALGGNRWAALTHRTG